MKTKLIFPLLLWSLFAALPAFSQSDSTSAANETTIILVRHAEKVDDGTSDPVLSEAGEKRAVHLSDWLNENYEISAVYSTKYQRTKLTAQASADAKKLEVVEYDFKDPVGLLKNLVEEHQGKSILIVGHSNTTPMFANILLGKREFEQLDEDVYDRIFIIKTSDFGTGTAEIRTY